jgi:hypothetical protein
MSTNQTSSASSLDPHKRHVTPLVSGIIGGIAGVCEVLIQQPTVAFKNAIQGNRAIPRNPLHWYRGVFINAASIAPITATQFCVNSLLIKGIHGQHGKPSSAEKLLYGATAGAVSGTISGPAELMLIQQQITGQSLVQQFKSVLKQQHDLKVSVRQPDAQYPNKVNALSTTLLLRGMGTAMLRDGTFACGYLGAAPVISSYIQQSSYSTDNKTADNLAGAVIAGVIVGIVSHPLDTLKTIIQTDLHVTHTQYQNLYSTYKNITEQRGYRALFRGFIPRAIRICGAVFIINGVGQKLTELYENA